MKNHGGVIGHHEPEHHISEGVEKRQDAEDAFVAIEMKHLRGTLTVHVDAEVGKHDSLGLSGAAAAENYGGETVRREAGRLPAGPFD